MNPESFARLREILLELAELPETDRRDHVERRCRNDPELLRHALRFLDAPDRDFEVLRTGGLAGLAREALDEGDRTVPERIGPFRIRSLLGEGGMGRVYLAEQEEPVRREVAVKILQAGLDTERVLARFETERQTLARMEHRNIARLLEAGSDSEKRPYFVMELVQGPPVTEYCRREGLSIRERVELLRDACTAVHHAHQKGVVHRDLKPSNLLIRKGEEGPVLKIIDFGVAFALEDAASERLTAHGEMPGTLDYMSPEQAMGDASKLDTRTDIYSLGVILYELLTGRRPYETRGRPTLEGLRVIIQESPESPIRSPEGSPVDADLEIVLMTALAKDPDARYSSAAAFAEDLENWLEGRPIQARRPTTTYMLRKLVQRNRRAFALAAAVFLMIVGFGVVMSVLFEGQRRERARAVTAVRAEENVNDFVRRMLASVDPRVAGRDVTVLEILENTARTVENADMDDVVRASIHRTLGTSYTALGDFPEGARHLERGLELLEAAGNGGKGERAGILLDLSENLRRQGRYEEARQRAGLALDVLAADRDTDPVERTRCLSQLALIQVDAGGFAEAESLSAQVLVELGTGPGFEADKAMAMHTYGRALLEQGKTGEAEGVLREAAALWKTERGADDPDYLETLNNLAMSMNRQSRQSESEPIQREVLETRRRILGDSHAEVAEAHNNLAMNLMYQGRRLDECEGHFLQAIAIWGEIFEGAHPHMVIGYNNLGFLRQNRFDYSGAERAYRQALDIQEALGDDATVARAYPLVNLGALLRGKKRFAESEACLQESHRLFLEILGPDHPLTSVAACELGTLYLDWNRSAEAREFLVPAREKLPIPGAPRGYIVRNALACLDVRESPGKASRDSLAASCVSLLGVPTLAEWRYQALLRTARFCAAVGEARAASRWRTAADSLMAAVSRDASDPAGTTARTSN